MKIGCVLFGQNGLEEPLQIAFDFANIFLNPFDLGFYGINLRVESLANLFQPFVCLFGSFVHLVIIEPLRPEDCQDECQQGDYEMKIVVRSLSPLCNQAITL